MKIIPCKTKIRESIDFRDLKGILDIGDKEEFVDQLCKLDEGAIDTIIEGLHKIIAYKIKCDTLEEKVQDLEQKVEFLEEDEAVNEDVICSLEKELLELKLRFGVIDEDEFWSDDDCC